MTPKEIAFYSKHEVVGPIRERLSKRGYLDIFQYIDKILEGDKGPWKSKPMGFKFRCRDRAGLAGTLLRSPHFARGKIFKDEGIREVSSPDSLHLGIDRQGNDYIHLDSISIAADKGADGYVIYKDYQTVLRHIQVDLLHVDEGVATPMDSVGRNARGW
jgi:hypothetical protein